MNGLAHIRRIIIPRNLFECGHEMLRDIGTGQTEGLILWAGDPEGEVFRVQAVLQPAQRGVRTADGLCVLVDGVELHRIGAWLYQERLQLVAQIHSHPTDAYHSSTDDAIPIVATEGGLSLVVPDFARGRACIDNYAVYRLDSDGQWQELASAEANRLIEITPPSNR